MLLATLFLGALQPLLPSSLVGLAAARLDLRVLGAAIALALLVGIGAAIWPALRATGAEPSAMIKSGGYAGTHANAGRGRRALVGAQVMLTVLLMVGAGLLLRSAEALDHINRGMALGQVGSLDVALPVLPTPRDIWDTLHSYAQVKDIWGLQRQRGSVKEMLRHLEETPGIDAASFVDAVPFGASEGSLGTYDFFVDGTFQAGAPRPEGAARKLVREHTISGSYFATLGIPVVAGRTFTAADDSTSPAVGIVSQAVARRYIPGPNPIGKTFHIGAGSNTTITIVGVVGDVSERGIDVDTFPKSMFRWNSRK